MTVVTEIYTEKDFSVKASIYSALQAVNDNERENIRICKALKRAGIITVDELLGCSEEVLLSLRSIGTGRATIVVKAIENINR